MHNSCVMHCDNARPLEYHWPIGRRKIFSLDDLHLHQIKSSSKWRLGPKMRLILPSLPLHLHPSLTLSNSPHLSSFLFNPFCARNPNSINVTQASATRQYIRIVYCERWIAMSSGRAGFSPGWSKIFISYNVIASPTSS
jgi:hypothetical protein